MRSRSNLPQRLGLWSRPTPTQLLLLRACLESGTEARSAWEKWSSMVDLDHLDYQSCYLLPLLDHNLRAIGVSGHPWLGRLKGYRRYIWAKNRRLLAQGNQLIEELRPLVGDQVLIIKGAALAWWYYSDSGLRPIDDFDFMVRPESAPRVLKYLKASGWKVPQWHDRYRRSIGRRHLSVNHSCNLEREDGMQIDLHWDLMHDLCGTNEIFWDAAVPMRLPDGTEVRTLEPSDLLFHCCLHGLIWSPPQSTRWITDCLILSQRVKASRWQRLTDVAERFRYTLQFGTALKYLASTFPRQAKIPEAIIHSLLDRDHSAEEVGEYQQRMLIFPYGEVKYPPSALTYYRRFRAHSMPQNRSWIQEIRSFADFLMKRWDLPNLWLVFLFAPFRAARRIYRKYPLAAGHAHAAATPRLAGRQRNSLF
jgi:putative nucleotidyltransferase-like protein